MHSTYVGPQVKQEEVQTTAEAQAGVKVGEAAKQVALSVPQVRYSRSIIYPVRACPSFATVQTYACVLGLKQPQCASGATASTHLLRDAYLPNHKKIFLQVQVALMCASNAISQDTGQAIVPISHHHATKHHAISGTCVEKSHCRFCDVHLQGLLTEYFMEACQKKKKHRDML